MDITTDNNDRRIRKTKRAIYKAMGKLMAEKDINDISVKDIADYADINRKTFYNHYSGVYQLVDEIENEIVDYFAELIENTDFAQALDNPAIVFDNLYETITQHCEFVDALFNTRGPSSLVSKVQGKLIEMTRDAAVEQFHSDPERTEVIIRFIFAGELAAYQSWYRSGMRVPIKELSRTIETLCTKGLNGLLNE